MESGSREIRGNMKEKESASERKFNIEVLRLKPTSTSGGVQGHADVGIRLPLGFLRINGFSIIHKQGQKPWIGFPQKPGTTAGRYFPVVEVEDSLLKELICSAILDAYKEQGSTE